MNSPSPQDQITIPVIIDDVKKLENFSMSRCTYFSIQCDTPSPGWTLTIGNISTSFLMMGMSGIIYSPADGSDRFDHHSTDHTG